MAQVLLVDDDTNVLLTLAIALRRQGHAVTVAHSGRQALQLLDASAYAFLVSDVRMPGMTGVELAEQVQSLAHPPRVILTSALAEPDEATSADFFLPKPVDLDVLNGVLQNGCDNARTDLRVPSR